MTPFGRGRGCEQAVENRTAVGRDSTFDLCPVPGPLGTFGLTRRGPAAACDAGWESAVRVRRSPGSLSKRDSAQRRAHPRRPSVRPAPLRLSGPAILACTRVQARHTLIGVRRRVMSGGGPPGSVSASESTSGASALEWLELAQGTTREALAERLAQAHLTDLDRQSLPTGAHTRRAAGKH
jgi:hypothetical protein